MMTLELEEIVANSASNNSKRMSKLLSLKERAEWKHYHNRLPESMQDIYYTPEYYEIYEKNLTGKAMCFVFQRDNELALYPFLLNKINSLDYKLNDNFYDICGAYGYNGVIYSSAESDFINSFYVQFSEFCNNNNIIAEFTRFNPALNNQIFSQNHLNLIYNRRTVSVDLTKSYDEIFNNYSRSTKQNIKRATSSGLITKIFYDEYPYKNEFVDIYKNTMSRVKADSYLIFDDSYFNNTFKNLPLIQFVIFKDSKPIASALCLHSKNLLHMHFVGYYSNFQMYRPNDLLYDEVIKHGIESGYKLLHLGGGRSLNENDSLLRFKKNFSDITNKFFIGKKIYNEKIYQIVNKQWEEKYPLLVDKYKNRVLSYRYFK